MILSYSTLAYVNLGSPRLVGRILRLRYKGRETKSLSVQGPFSGDGAFRRLVDCRERCVSRRSAEEAKKD